MPLPTPEPGLVICYSYLWKSEASQGQVEGVKNRPCAIVLCINTDEENSSQPKVVVAPITHSQPADSTTAIELPLSVKQHLGLDEERSWVIVNDFNLFRWPGYDLRLNTQGDHAYGLLPPDLFKKIIQRFSELRKQSRTIITPRDDI